ncbi:HAD family hydrolase [Streptomyces sp. NPDC046860]|uniref:HAD family hydrolase n=1 Tax=Streptomyces sp. NPDC046860 TaxID=3154495 RepID=UPI0033D119AF
MTSETTETTPHEPATTEKAGKQTADETARLRELTGARAVLWDFEGPVCRLFAGRRAREIAAGLVEWLAGRGLDGLLTEEERATSDPQVVLRAVDRRHPGSDLVTELEEHLTQEELRAAATAWPTAYADPLIRTWSAVGARLAVTTGYSSRAVSTYLAGRGLSDCFAPHVHGRTTGPDHLTSDPHRLREVLRALDVDAAGAVLIGSTPQAVSAAGEAGVRFLGHAANEDGERLLRAAGADLVLTSLEPLLRALRDAGSAVNGSASAHRTGRARG